MLAVLAPLPRRLAHRILGALRAGLAPELPVRTDPSGRTHQPARRPRAHRVPLRPVEATGPKVAVHTEATPNPNAMKFSVSVPVLERGSLVFGSPAEAAGHPLGRALFALDGVASVFAVGDFVTVTRTPDVGWDLLCPRIEAVLSSVLAT